MRVSRIAAALAAAPVLVAGGIGVAYADNVQNNVSSSAGSNASRTITAGKSTIVNYWIDNTSAGSNQACDATPTSPVTVTIKAPTAVTTDKQSLQFTSCGTATSNTQSVTFSSNVPTSTGYAIDYALTYTSGTYNAGSAKFTLYVTDAATPPPPPPPVDGDGDQVPDVSDNCPDAVNPEQADADNDGVGDACDDNNYAPEVDLQAGPADGLEGEPNYPTTTGSFKDADGDLLSIKQTAGVGSIQTDGKNGFTWGYVSADDADGYVTVEASDGDSSHPSAVMTFHWTASNADPVVTHVSASAVSACSVQVGASFTDQGTVDTHTASIDWGDGSGVTAIDDADAGISGTHTYSSNNTYTVGVTVTDDDEGTGFKALENGFTTKNTPSAILQPINSTGTRSSFKAGSTIPVKITVTGCDAQPVSALAPVVSLVNTDNSPDLAVNEVASTATPTSGNTMRWSNTDAQYIYNLSTKNSQLSGGTALSAGTYKVMVSDPSFYVPVAGATTAATGSAVSASFDLRK